MLPVDNDQPLILDLAASPGGKTTHITSRTGDRGLVIANDASLSRLPALRSVLQNWGAINIATTSFPGEQFGDWFPECFDKVLLDAPCSMENLRSTASHPMRAISPRERQGLAQRQARLLSSAFTSRR
jgi:16S rRNA (cytosine1407-C5)-methyltransferase